MRALATSQAFGSTRIAGPACSLRRSAVFSLTGEPPEEAIGIPLRAGGRVGHPLRQIQDDVVKLGGGGFVHRLVQVVRRSMIAVRQPILVQLFLGRAGQVAELKRESRNAMPDEAVLVTTDEKIALRLLVGLHFDSDRARHR